MSPRVRPPPQLGVLASLNAHSTTTAAPQSKWQRIQRAAATFELTLGLGEPTLAPQSPVRVRDYKPMIDNTEWLTIKTTHSFKDGGYSSRAELEVTGAGDEEVAGDADRTTANSSDPPLSSP